VFPAFPAIAAMTAFFGVIFCEILIRETASLNSCNSLNSSYSFFRRPFDFSPFEGYRWRFCQ
jgi:hypothetical protein